MIRPTLLLIVPGATQHLLEQRLVPQEGRDLGPVARHVVRVDDGQRALDPRALAGQQELGQVLDGLSPPIFTIFSQCTESS